MHRIEASENISGIIGEAENKVLNEISIM